MTDNLNIFKLKHDLEQRLTNNNAAAANGKRRLNSNPLLLNQSIAKYKETFQSRKITYLEQETKERFLRAIISDPPTFVESADTKAAEEQTKLKKSQLQSQKQRAAQTLDKLTSDAKSIADKYQRFNELSAKCGLQQAEIDRLQSQLTDLQAAHDRLQLPEIPDHPELNDILSAEDLAELEAGYDDQIARLQDEIDSLTESCSTIDADTVSAQQDISSMESRLLLLDSSTRRLIQQQQEDEMSRRHDINEACEYYNAMTRNVLDLCGIDGLDVHCGDDKDGGHGNVENENDRDDVQLMTLQLKSSSCTIAINNNTGKIEIKSDGAKTNPVIDIKPYLSQQCHAAGPPDAQLSRLIHYLSSS